MKFKFVRDEEGREKIYVGDAIVARVQRTALGGHIIETGGLFGPVPGLEHDFSAAIGAIEEAYGHADERGFWDRRQAEDMIAKYGVWFDNECTVEVDVPATKNAASSLSGDDS
jgi:hypothetical protein